MKNLFRKNNTHYLFSLLFILNSFNALAQVQWANKVIGYSSYFNYDKNPKAYNTDQILGKPSVATSLKAPWCVWTAATANGGNEWVQVGFERAQEVAQIIVCETYNMGAITEVWAYKENDKNPVQVYSNTTPTIKKQLEPLRVIPDKPLKNIRSVKVVLNTAAIKGHNPIDAIGISSSTEPVFVGINLPKNLERHTLVRLPDYINTSDKELLPVVTPDGKRLYYTLEYPTDGEKTIQDIWFANIEGDSFSQPTSVGAPLNRSDKNNAIASITPDGQTALVINVYHKDGSASKGISVSKKSGNGWGFPIKQEIEDFENKSDYGEYFLSNDQQVMIMTVFRSDVSYGDKDLYVCFRTGENSWSKPLNMGKDLNTAASEISPFLAADGKTLYFATKGHPGYGNTDLFFTKRLDDTWTNWSEPVNLGPDVNTPDFDAYYSIAASGDFAYFSSKHDLYRIRLNEEVKPEPVVLVKGFVKDKETLKPLATDITYLDLETHAKVGIANSDSLTGYYEIVLPFGKTYSFFAEKRGYYAIQDNLATESIAEYTEIERDLFLAPVEVGKSITLNNIFFYRGKADLLPTSNPELDKLLELMNAHTTMHIKIEGHADNVGNQALNLKLSKDRSARIKTYLVDKGINPNRIETEGYGGSRPVGDNRFEEGRKKNRRVEFTITKI